MIIITILSGKIRILKEKETRGSLFDGNDRELIDRRDLRITRTIIHRWSLSNASSEEIVFLPRLRGRSRYRLRSIKFSVALLRRQTRGRGDTKNTCLSAVCERLFSSRDRLARKSPVMRTGRPRYVVCRSPARVRLNFKSHFELIVTSTFPDFV